MSTDSVSEAYMERLRQYLVDAEQAPALEAALVEAEWDDALDEGLRDALARIRLVLSEVAQDMRPAVELRVEIVRLLASITADSLGSSPSTEVDVDLVNQLSISRLFYSLDSGQLQEVEVLTEEAAELGVPAGVPPSLKSAEASNSLEEVEVISEAVVV